MEMTVGLAFQHRREHGNLWQGAYSGFERAIAYMNTIDPSPGAGTEK